MTVEPVRPTKSTVNLGQTVPTVARGILVRIPAPTPTMGLVMMGVRGLLTVFATREPTVLIAVLGRS